MASAIAWCRDWMDAATHDPEFWSYRLFSLRLIWWDYDLEEGNLRIYLSWVNCPRFRLHHPREWGEWSRRPVINYDTIPF